MSERTMQRSTKKRTWAQRESVLRDKRIRRELSAHVLSLETAAVNGERARVTRFVCSAPWFDAHWKGEAPAPFGPGGMRLSRAKTRWGDTGRPSRRWTPAGLVGLEDRLDEMSIGEATRYHHPPAIRYDHTRPQQDAIVYDPRAVRVIDPPAFILRCVKLGEWPVERLAVRVTRAGVSIGGAVVCHAMPLEPIVERWVQSWEG